LPPTKPAIELAAAKLISFGISKNGCGGVIIRCGELGAFVLTRERGGQWFDAYWRDAADHHQVVDVTGNIPQLIGHRS
jgi:sugar/nucleoside kinase (ribokinase family)